MNRQLLVFGTLLVLLGAVGYGLYVLLAGGTSIVRRNAATDASDATAPRTGVFVDDNAPLPASWEQLVAELNNSRASRRVTICEALGGLRDPAAAGALAGLVVRDSAASVRLAALHALIAVRPDDLGERLTAFLDHPDELIRTATLRGLGNLADAASLRPLLDRLRDRDYKPKWLVIDAIASMKLDACVSDLARLATDHTQPKQDRIRALGHLGSFKESSEARSAIDRCARDADTDIARIARAIQ